MSDDKVTDIRERLAAVTAGTLTEPTKPIQPKEPEGPKEYLYEFVIDNPERDFTDLSENPGLTISEFWEGYLIVTQTFVAVARGVAGEIMFFVPVSRLHMVKIAEDPDEVVEA